ncbi:hypothetical protein M440DRAFT_1333822 [Trichoderma longibrachiatum ATCC 18648]|uniref:Fucose-specific lectin n=1 Tax=Trichoderma longibrachiatum ATCC 18648 TaxID=983965 RepID=A0A2T4C4H5_TRILO|nr:hypothetical protein M440DRAFT_1333822 [Trichoderma longibrachiatum ATCC 18648]
MSGSGTAGRQVVQRVDSPPGLEVSTHAQVGQGLEVFGDDGLQVVNFGLDSIGGDPKGEAQIKETERKAARKKLWLIITGIVSLLVIVAAVVGGVVASRHRHTSSSAGSQASSTPSPSSIPSKPPSSPNDADARSGIGVTGWWTGSSSFNIRLVYRGQDGDLRVMGYHSGDGNWSRLATLEDTKAKRGTPIAASSFNVPVFYFTPVTSTNNYMQSEIFYLNDQDELQEWVFREQDTNSSSAQTHNGSGIMSSKGWKAGSNSRLASYWPSLIYQDGDNLMQEAYCANLTWSQEKVGLKSHEGSVFAEIPYSVNAAASGGERIIYQSDDRKLLVMKRNNLTDELSADAPAFTIPTGAPMGAFTVPRDSDKSNVAMNTYILWQGNTGALQMTWEDDSTGWRTSSTPASLGRLDNGTDIACLTPTIWSVTSLQSSYGMARCYYLVNGHIREVHYDGSNWSVIGNVQLD